MKKTTNFRRSFRSTHGFALGLAGLVLGCLLSAQAASITWGTPATISGDTDVSTSGTLLYAYNGANSTVTVNGVSFTGKNSSTTWGSVTFNFTGSTTTAYGGGSSTPWANLSSNYKTDLQGGNYRDGAAVTVTLGALTSGHQYLVQIWVNDSRGTTRTETVTGGGGNTVTLSYCSTGNTAGGVGQYASGNFTADATSQTFTLTGSASSQLNAIQVRDVTPQGPQGYFSGASGSIWDASTTSDWATNSGGTYNQTWAAILTVSTNAIFEGTAGTVTINGTVSAGNITFSTDGYTLAEGTSGLLTLGGSTAITTGSGSDTIGAVLGGAGSVTKNGSGALTLSGANTYAGGTTLNSGQLNINNAGSGGTSSAIGTGVFTISGGTIDNTSSSDITLSPAIAQSWNSDFTYAGSAHSLNLGTGAVTLGANRQVTVSANTLTVGGTIGDGGHAYSLTKAGAGTLALSAATNTFTGQLQVSGGTLVWNTAGALAPTATYEPLNITSGGALIVNGPLLYTSGGSGNVYAYLNIGNNAAGGIGTLTINSGGSLTFTNQTSDPTSIIGQQGTGGTSKLVINGGSFNWDRTGGLVLGNAGGSGLLLITNGGIATILKGTGTTEERYIELGHQSTTSTGTVYLATGTLATDRVIATGVAAGGGVGYVFFDGGTLKALDNQSDWLQAAVNGYAYPPDAVTIADGGAKIDANGFSVTINNNLLHGGVAATDGGLTKLGLGTLTLGGSGHTYNGPTIVSNGVLAVTGSLPSASAVTVAGGTFTVSGSVGGTVTVQPGGAVGASSGTFNSLVTLNTGNSAVNLQDGSATTTTFANGLTLNNGNVLAFDLGSSSDQIYVPGTFTHNGTATINLAAISGISATTYYLIYDGAADITSTNGFVIGTVPGGYSATLDVSGGSLIVTLAQSAPAVAYWTGDADNQWNTLTGGINSNWATDSTGATDTGAVPGTPTAVTFAATGAANLNTVLGADFTINNLTLSTANNVTIGGTTNTLTLIAGLLNDTTALVNTISVSNVVLGSSQTWQNNSANPLTVSSLISGASALTIGGSGSIVLTSTNNSYSGGTVISGGTLQLGDGIASNGAVAGNITNYSALTFANPAAQTFSGNLDGSGSVTKSGAGTLTFPADNTYYGATTVSNGSLVIVTGNGAGTGNINVQSGATLVCQPTTTTTYANTVTGTGLVKLLFGNEGLGYNNTGDWFTHLDNLSGFTGTIQLSATTSTNVNKWTVDTAAVSGTSSLIIDSGAQLYLTGGNSLTFSTLQVNGAGNYQNRGAIRAGSGTLTGAMSLLGDTTFGTEGGTIAGTIASGAAGTQILTLGGTADLAGNITLNADIGGGTGTIALNKINSGTTTLSGNNTFTGPTTNSAGTLTLANGSALQNSTLNITAGTLVFDSSVVSNAFVFGGLSGTANITLANNASSPIALSIGNNGSSTVFSGALNDNGTGSSLTKVGNGTLTLSGANSYGGTTTVAGGKLAISTLLTNATTGIAVNDGTTLTITAVGTNQVVPATYTLGSSTGPVTNEFAGLSSTTIAPVNAGALTLAGQTTVNINGGSFVAGNVYPLISFASIGGAGGFNVGSLPRGMMATIVTNGGNTIALNVTSFAPVKNVWTGSVNTNWDIATTANWQTNGVAGVYVDGDSTRFDDTATATNVFVTTVVSPSSMMVSNVSKTFTFAGNAVSGSGGLTKQGGGLLVLAQANTYSGNTVISNGTLQLGVANAIPGGAGKGDVSLAGSLDLNGNSDVINGLSGSGTVDTVAGGTPTLTLGSSGSSSTFSGIIQNTAGTLTLTKNGSGTLTLGGNNTYSGATTVSAGTLRLANTNALGSTAGGTTVATNATLDLNGQGIAENLNLNSGASLVNNSASPAAVSGNVIADNSSFTVIGGTGNITFATITHVSGYSNFDVTNLNTGTIDLAGTVDNGFMNMHVAAGTVLLDKLGAGQRACSTLFVEGGTAKLGNTNGDQIFDGNALTINSGTFDLNGQTETVGNLVGSGGAILNSAASTTGILTIGGVNAGGGDYYGNITDGAGKVGLTKTGTGTAQTLQGVNTYSGPTVIANGTLTLVGGAGISNSVLVNVLGTLNVTYRNDQTLSLTAVQTLTGTGTVNGNLTSAPGSIINPGGINAVGTLTVSGNASLSGTLLMELSRTNTPSNCDQLTITGTPTYGGTLLVTNIGDALQAGDKFQLFSTAVSGFAVNLATTDATGYTYTWTNNLAADGSVIVATATAPVTINTNPPVLQVGFSNHIMSLAWPTNAGWILQSNSVGLTAASAWYPYPADGSTNVTSVNITVDPSKTNVFFRMVKP